MIHRAAKEDPLVLTADMIVPPGAGAPNAADLLRASAAEVAAAADGAILLLTGEIGPRSGDTPLNEAMIRPAAASLPAALLRNLLAPVVLPATAPKLRPLRGFSLALLLHVAVLGSLFGFFNWHRKPPPPPQMMEISMALESAATQPARPVQRQQPLPAVQKPAPVTPFAPPVPAVSRPAILPVAAPPAPSPPRPKPVLYAPPAPVLEPSPPLPPHPASAMNIPTIPAHPDPLGQIPPDYPAASRQRGEEGEVLLSIHVLADGFPDSVVVAKSCGYPELDEAARDAVLRWHFAPALPARLDPVSVALAARKGCIL
jgi:protein TonB